MNLEYKWMNQNDLSEEQVDQMARFLAEDDQGYKGNLDFFKWYKDLEDEKFVALCYEGDKLIGLARFWMSHYCDKWLIEGLEVDATYRGKRIGTKLIELGCTNLSNISSDLYVNISYRNLPSIGLHERLGFKLISQGADNSFGEYRPKMNQYKLSLPCKA